MTVQEVAKAVGLSEAAIYKMIRQHRSLGQDFVYQPGKGYRFVGKLEDKNA
jgi:excisionase family DNA binding protein